MRILTVFTGGTIGSLVRADGKISTTEDTKYLLISEYEKLYGKKATFKTIEPYRILSENLKAEHIEKLIFILQEYFAQDTYDGVIITHGTDTLQYTAAALQYVFGGVDFPILLVSSDYVLTEPKSNGLNNFATSVDFIEGHFGTGVFVSYCNSGDIPKIHRGTRMQNSLTYSAEMNSIKEGEYGSFMEGKFMANPNYCVSNDDIKSMFAADSKVKLLDNESVLRLRVFPGMRYPTDTSGVKAVLYESYHSGTLCIDKNLEYFAKQMQALNVPVYVTGLDDTENEYETVEMFRNLGIITVPNRAAIAQYVKLWLACSNDLDVRQVMMNSYGEEYCI